MSTRIAAIVALALLLASAGSATTFVVPDDRDFITRTDTIVIGSPLSSYTQLTDKGTVETVTPFSIEEVIKGDLIRGTIDVHEAGGVYKGRGLIIPSTPRFQEGQRYLLFLMQAAGIWHVRDLVIGQFRFATDAMGRDILIRDDDIAGWDPDGPTHVEQHRAASPFLQFIRASVQGQTPAKDYFVPKDPVLSAKDALMPLASVAPISARLVRKSTTTFSATSYTITTDGTEGGPGARWNVFPAPISFFFVGSEMGAQGTPAGKTAIDNAMAAWTNDPSSNVNYLDAGQDTSGMHLGGLQTFDPTLQNTIQFEQNLTWDGIVAFTCSGSGFSGVLGIGGPWFSGTHLGPNGETFATTIEGDVEMNQGVANCTQIVGPASGPSDFNSALTHEVGHTLGFRHLDQTRLDNISILCPTDSSLDCATSGIMNHFITQGVNGVLQAWDLRAVAAVYPNPVVTYNPPTNVVATATGSTTVNITWTAATGTVPVQYDVYRTALLSGGFGASIGHTLSPGTSFNDTTAVANTAYLYKVKSAGAGGTNESSGSNNDLATTVIYTNPTLTVGTSTIQAVDLTQLRTAVNAVAALAGTGAGSFTDPTITVGVTTVKAVHITQLRTNLNSARGTLGLSAVTFAHPTLTVGTTPVTALDFNELRAGVQ